jgi:hypothetical protein
VIQSCYISNKKSQTLKDENFTKSAYFMKMKKNEYCSLFRPLNERQKLIFDDVMHFKKKKNLIHQFVCFLPRVLELVKNLHYNL